MFTTERITLDSKYDGLPLSVMLVRPEGEVRCLVQLAHGMCEHKERYQPFMEFLASRGCLCAIHDHRGHGASVRSADDLGYFYADGDQGVVEDLHQITRWMRDQWPELPLILFGHSMGSLAVRAYADSYDKDIDALIVCGSPGENAAAGVGLVLIRLLSAIFGERHHSALVQKMTIGAFAKRFPSAEHPSSWISANVENVIAYEADPLCTFTFTLNGNRALLRLMRRAYGLSPTRGNPQLPVRFFSGAEDPCAPDEKGFWHAVERMKQAGFADVEGKLFPGLRHEILNEVRRQEVFETIWRDAIAPLLKQN